MRSGLSFFGAPTSFGVNEVQLEAHPVKAQAIRISIAKSIRLTPPR
jgi:hypothetical protein